MKSLLEMFFSRRNVVPHSQRDESCSDRNTGSIHDEHEAVAKAEGSATPDNEADHGEAIISIPGQAKVGTVKNRFHLLFGLTLRIYDGRSFAALDKTIGQVRKRTGVPKLAISQASTVLSVEKQFLKECGLRVQIAGSDDSYLCNNDLTLKDALDEDKRRITSRRKTYAPEFKLKVAQAASQRGAKLASVAERYGVSVATVYQWKKKHAPKSTAQDHDGGVPEDNTVVQRDGVDVFSMPLGRLGASPPDYVYAGDNTTWGDGHSDFGIVHVIKPSADGDGAWDFIRGTVHQTISADDIDYDSLTATFRQLLPELDEHELDLLLWVATEDEYGEGDDAMLKEGSGAEFAPDELPENCAGAFIVGRTVWRDVVAVIEPETGDVNIDDDHGEVETDDDAEICLVFSSQ